jgi:hypothetical protein
MGKAHSFLKRFPAPWRTEELPDACRVVDRNGTPLIYAYSPAERVRAATPNTSLTREEAHALCGAIALIPNLLQQQGD